MARAIPHPAKAALWLAGLLAASGVAVAGGGSLGDASKKTGNSFNLLYTATAPNAPTIAPGAGAGVPQSKRVVTNPYNVPLIQNAGSLHGR
jgi:hypothetical protein